MVGVPVNTHTERDEIARINAELAQYRGRSRSSDGAVAIEVDPSGYITSIYIADYAMDGGPDRLAELIADRHRVAMNDVQQQALRLYESKRPVERDEARAPDSSITDEHANHKYIPSHLRR